jgi:hypothetical protein
MAFFPIPQGLPDWLYSECQTVEYYGYTVVQATPATATFPDFPGGIDFLVPVARQLNRYGWSVQ